MHRVLEVADVDDPHQHADDSNALQQASRLLSSESTCRETLTWPGLVWLRVVVNRRACCIGRLVHFAAEQQTSQHNTL